MDVLNFIEKQDFPLSSTWLDKQYQITAQLADSIAKMVMQQPRFTGTTAVIYSGCETVGGTVNNGYIVYNGILYQFKSSPVNTYLVLKKQDTTVTVGTETYMTYQNWWLELSDTNTGGDIQAAIEWVGVPRYSNTFFTKVPNSAFIQPLATNNLFVKKDIGGNTILNGFCTLTYDSIAPYFVEIFTLPAEYRPTEMREIPIQVDILEIYGTGSSGLKTYIGQVETSGLVRVNIPSDHVVNPRIIINYAIIQQ